jgi:hypothetical protein
MCLPPLACWSLSRSLSAASGVREGSLSLTERVVAVWWQSERESSDEYESSEEYEYDRLAELEVGSLLCSDAPGRSVERWRELLLRCITACTRAPPTPRTSHSHRPLALLERALPTPLEVVG